jgi:23S rRNA (pseudouridine1915-N3)-methyltransferase
MKLVLVSFGKAHDAAMKAGIEDFTKRLNRYHNAEWVILPPPKTATASETIYKQKEAETFWARFDKSDYLVCLDERGQNISSPELAAQIAQRANDSVKRLVFVIGGAYGIHESILKAARFKWSLSRLVFPHQLVRLILAEQLYRACTILNNEKYHHE